MATHLPRILVTLAAAVAVTATGSPAGAVERPHVVVVGDSLVNEAADTIRAAGIERGWDIEVMSFGGTAPCDWTAALRDTARRHHPEIVIVSFSGNNFTPCMQDASGAAITGHALLEKYQHDLVELRHAAPGARFAFAGQPPMLIRDITPMNVAQAQIAATLTDTVWFDAGATVAGADRGYTTLDRCRPGEATHCRGTRLVVRNPDGVHFCPRPRSRVVTADATAPCPVHSPGAIRFGQALVAL